MNPLNPPPHKYEGETIVNGLRQPPRTEYDDAGRELDACGIPMTEYRGPAHMPRNHAECICWSCVREREREQAADRLRVDAVTGNLYDPKVRGE